MGIFLHLITAALDVIFPPKDTERIVREISEVEFGRLLAPTVTKTGVITLLPYRHRVVRAVIVEAKFKANQKAIRLLGGVLADYVLSHIEETSSLEESTWALVPVPLGNKRRLERGYNQVEEVAKAARVLPVTHTLVRTRDTLPQTSLGRAQRLTNVEGAFTVLPCDAHAGYIVLDDVFTTGATLRAAVQALKSAGARRVMALALAH